MTHMCVSELRRRQSGKDRRGSFTDYAAAFGVAKVGVVRIV